jgi:cbb3-type cytochrome oxidase maturation protein
MEILMLLIPLSVVLVFLIGAVFWWSVRSGQFDDLEGPAHQIIADDDPRFDLHQRPAQADSVASQGSAAGARVSGTGTRERHP